MKFLVLDSFRRDYNSLPTHVREQVDKALLLLQQNPRHPSLHSKRIQGTRDIWEARVTLAYRLTFQREGDAMVLRRVGTHAILSKEAKK